MSYLNNVPETNLSTSADCVTNMNFDQAENNELGLKWVEGKAKLEGSDLQVIVYVRIVFWITFLMIVCGHGSCPSLRDTFSKALCYFGEMQCEISNLSKISKFFKVENRI